MTATVAGMTSALARLAYSTLEPYHVAAYFNPDLPNAYSDTGLDGHAFYVGARGAPLGPCAPAVVSSTFYNFSPALIAAAWPAAVEVGLESVGSPLGRVGHRAGGRVGGAGRGSAPRRAGPTTPRDR